MPAAAAAHALLGERVLRGVEEHRAARAASLAARVVERDRERAAVAAQHAEALLSGRQHQRAAAGLDLAHEAPALEVDHRDRHARVLVEHDQEAVAVEQRREADAVAIVGALRRDHHLALHGERLGVVDRDEVGALAAVAARVHGLDHVHLAAHAREVAGAAARRPRRRSPCRASGPSRRRRARCGSAPSPRPRPSGRRSRWGAWPHRPTRSRRRPVRRHAAAQRRAGARRPSRSTPRSIPPPRGSARHEVHLVQPDAVAAPARRLPAEAPLGLGGHPERPLRPRRGQPRLPHATWTSSSTPTRSASTASA